MKNLKILKGVLFVLLLFIPLTMILAQEVEPIEDVVDLMVNFKTLVGSMAGYVAISVFLTGLVNGWLKAVKSWVKQVISWIVPTVLVILISLVFKTGFLAGESVLKIIVFGLGTGLVSNGVFDIAFVNTAVNWLVTKLGGVTK